MKTFEERYTAWIDGQLKGRELVEFEKELEQTHPEAEADKADALRLGDLLRRHATAPALTNGDFFNHQLMARIRKEQRDDSPVPLVRPRFRWALPNLAWAGACSLLMAFALYRNFIPSQLAEPKGQQFADVVTMATPALAAIPARPAYNAEILKADSDEPGISVTPIHSDKEKVTVVWVDGLDYLPASYEIH